MAMLRQFSKCCNRETHTSTERGTLLIGSVLLERLVVWNIYPGRRMVEGPRAGYDRLIPTPAKREQRLQLRHLTSSNMGQRHVGISETNMSALH